MDSLNRRDALNAGATGTEVLAMAELKPCPFCGQEKYIVVLAEGHCDNRQYQIVCDASGEGGCGASCGWQDTLKEAKEAWNRRADNG